MARLIASHALEAGALQGPATVISVDPGQVTWIGAWLGETESLSARFPPPGWPEPNRSRAGLGLRIIHAGLGQVLVIGAAPVVRDAAVVDQTDAWAGLHLSGRAHRAVLERLCPVDLRANAFPVDGVARTLLGQIPAILVRTCAAEWLILVPRSMAKTAWEEVAQALARVAARA